MQSNSTPAACVITTVSWLQTHGLFVYFAVDTVMQPLTVLSVDLAYVSDCLPADLRA